MVGLPYVDNEKTEHTVSEQWYVRTKTGLFGPVPNAYFLVKDKNGKELQIEIDGQQRPLLRDGDRHFMSSAWAYCRNLEQQSATASSQWGFIALPALAIGLPGAAAGTALLIDESAGDKDKDRMLARGTVAATGLLLSFLGVYALERSAAGGRASAAAGTALQKDDAAEVWKACSEARATWLSSREEALAEVRTERDFWREKAVAGMRAPDKSDSDEGGAGGEAATASGGTGATPTGGGTGGSSAAGRAGASP